MLFSRSHESARGDHRRMAEAGTLKVTGPRAMIALQLSLGTNMPALLLWTVAATAAGYVNAIVGWG